MSDTTTNFSDPGGRLRELLEAASNLLQSQPASRSPLSFPLDSATTAQEGRNENTSRGKYKRNVIKKFTKV